MLQDNATPQWYVVHTYSGYEKRVAANLEKIVENRNLGHLIFAVKVPFETVVNPANPEKEEERLLFPSYVFVKMIMNDESWHVVRNTSGVTGFVGPGSQPVLLDESEVESLGVETKVISLNYAVGDSIRIVEGSLKGHVEDAKVVEISPDFKTIKVNALIHGRSMTVELDSSTVEKIKD